MRQPRRGFQNLLGGRWNTNGGRDCTGACVKHTWQIDLERLEVRETAWRDVPSAEVTWRWRGRSARRQDRLTSLLRGLRFSSKAPGRCGSREIEALNELNRGKSDSALLPPCYLLCFHVYLIFSHHFQHSARHRFSHWQRVPGSTGWSCHTRRGWYAKHTAK